MIIGETKHTQPRLEIKFLFSDRESVLARNILDSIKGLYKSYNDREIHSLYFDTPQYSFARDNLVGLSNRRKYRYRYYNEDLLNGVVESKIKKNKVGIKQIFSPCRDIKQDLIFDLPNYFDQASKPLEGLSPISKITYKRAYYEYFDDIRVTLDIDIHVSSLDQTDLIAKKADIYYPRAIIEVKTSPENIEGTKEIIRMLSRSPVRHSKYLISLATLGKLQYL